VSLERPKIWVKVCGVTNLGDTLAAMGAGADLIGFNFSTRSPRCVTVDKVKGILREAPKGFLRVGVFQDAPVDEVVHAVKTLELHRVQLHGSEDPEAYKAAGVPLIKAFPVSNAEDVVKASATAADAILFDSRSPLGGGSGQTFDWSLLAGVQRRYFIAGGLNPGNVADVILKLHPYGVDVCSGVEKEPGKKDRQLLKTFVLAARAAEEQVFSQLRGR
jgi:phosphoribosylanthranilate isomerase